MVALITGAGRPQGLGAAASRLLARQGFHVIVTARSLSQAEERASELRAEGHSAEGLQLDLSDVGTFADVAERVGASHGRLDALVNNASVFPDMHTASALEASAEDIAAALDVDVLAPWALTAALRPVLEAAPAARVVNLTSGAFRQVEALSQRPGDVGAPAYSFAKQALNTLTMMLAAAFRDTRVLVNAVDPGRADTHPELGTDEEDVPPSTAAAWVAWAATLPEGGPTGGVFLHGERIA